MTQPPIMRAADQTPLCLTQPNAPIDEEQCQQFFAARQEIILAKGEVEPLIPLPKAASDKWQAFLRAGQANQPKRPKLAIAGVRPASSLLPPETKIRETIIPPRETENPPETIIRETKIPRETKIETEIETEIQGILVSRGRPKKPGQKPWEKEGLSKASWYRRRAWNGK